MSMFISLAFVLMAIPLIAMYASEGARNLSYSIWGVSCTLFFLVLAAIFDLFPEPSLVVVFNVWCGLALESVILLVIAIKEKSILDIGISVVFLVINYFISRVNMI